MQATIRSAAQPDPDASLGGATWCGAGGNWPLPEVERGAGGAESRGAYGDGGWRSPARDSKWVARKWRETDLRATLAGPHIRFPAMPGATDLLTVLGRSHDGLTLSELLRRLPEVPRRTLQRRLGRYVEQGVVIRSGRSRATRYALADEGAAAGLPEDPEASRLDEVVPLSPDSLEVLALVERPLASRTPVGYQREFLDEYEPNVTRYLPIPLSRQLHRIGSTGGHERPAGTFAREILDRLMIDLSWASSRLEGNTYSRLDTRRLIELGRAADGSTVEDTQMILNHKGAVELLVENIDSVGFDRYTLMNLHALLAENLLPNRLDEGRTRRHAVEIGRSVFRLQSTVALLDELVDVVLAKADAVRDPFEQSFFVMVHLPYLQPFADVNKRTSRLLANLPLLRANLCPLTFVGVPDHVYVRATLAVYELTRVELLRDVYVWAYERSARDYLRIRGELVAPDPLRLAWRETIREAVRRVVREDAVDETAFIASLVENDVDTASRDEVEALIVEELRGLHEGVLVRYALRPSEFARWARRRRAI